MGIIIEFRQVGNAVKVTAMDDETLTEVSITGPASASRQELEQAAVQKLKYVLSKASDEDTTTKGPARRGIIV